MSKVINTKKSFYSYFFFFLSPIFSIPLILSDIYKRKKSAVYLTAFFLALLSFYYVPYSYFDKVHYYEYYNDYKMYNFDKFLKETLTLRTDFIAYLLLFIFAKIGVSFHVFSAAVTGIPVFFCFNVFRKISLDLNLSPKVYFFRFILVAISFSYFHLLTGVRFSFASGFIVLAFYSLYKKEGFNRFFLYSLLALFSHFGTLLFVFSLFFYYYFQSKIRIIKIVFLVSIPLLFISRTDLFNFGDIPFIGELFAKKIEGYLGEEDFIELQMSDGSVYYEFKVFLTAALHIILLSAILVNFKLKSRMFIFMTTFLILGNILKSSPTVFERVTLIVNSYIGVLFFTQLLQQNRTVFVKITFYTYTIVLTLLFVLDFFLMYKSYIDSYRLIDFLVLLVVFFQDITDYGFST